MGHEGSPKGCYSKFLRARLAEEVLVHRANGGDVEQAAVDAAYQSEEDDTGNGNPEAEAFAAR